MHRADRRTLRLLNDGGRARGGLGCGFLERVEGLELLALLDVGDEARKLHGRGGGGQWREGGGGRACGRAVGEQGGGERAEEGARAAG
eukprot:4299253-Prymnesium_polylepis.1